MSITIRLATANDLESILQLFQETIEVINANDYSSKQIEVWKNGAGRKQRWLEKIGLHHFLVAELNNQIAGFASISKEGYLDFMYVSKDHQRRRIATELYKALEQFARENQFSKITSDVSITAKPFFQKQGFIVLHQQEVLIDGVPLINYKMEKFLSL